MAWITGKHERMAANLTDAELIETYDRVRANGERSQQMQSIGLGWLTALEYQMKTRGIPLSKASR